MKKIIYPTLWKPLKIYHCPRDFAVFSLAVSILFFPVHPFISIVFFAGLFLAGVILGRFDPEFFSVVWCRLLFVGLRFKNKYLNNKTPQNKAVVDKFPLIGTSKDGFLVSKTGAVSKVLEITGRDYSGLSDRALNNLFEIRKNLFRNLPAGLILLYQAHRINEENHNRDTPVFPQATASEIDKRWKKNFKRGFCTRHFLVITTETNLKTLLSREENGKVKSADLDKISEFTSDLISRLKDYGIVELAGDALASYYSFLLTGQERKIKLAADGLFDDFLTDTDLEFTDKDHQIYNSENRIYSSWLVVKAPAEITSEELLNRLFRVQVKLAVYQSFCQISQEQAVKLVHDKFKNAVAFIRDSFLIEEETDALKQRLQAGEISLLKHTFAIEVFGEDKGNLDENIRTVKEAVESAQYLTVRERLNIEALYWSKFPSLNYLNPRQREITTDNAAHFLNLSNPGEGLQACSWGNVPVTQFKTLSGSQYRFTFHQTASPKALGNTLIVGGSEAGKTTLISFLLTQSFKFQGFRALCFDRLNGLNVWTRFLNGEYLESETLTEAGLNPLQLPNSQANRAFLQSWFEMLLNIQSDSESSVINELIRRVYKMPSSTRHLENLKKELGQNTEGSLSERLKKWLPGGNFGAYFTGKKDALNFTNPLITIDNTATLENKAVIAPLTYYIFHRLFESVKTGGYAVFVDELNRYLESDDFASKIVVLLREIRKTDGVLIGAVQNVEPLLESEIASTILNNISTFLIFPEPRAIKHYYCEVPNSDGKITPNLGLNESEFKFIQGSHVRKILVKKRTGESAFLNTDLSSLKEYLNVFNSNRDAVRLLSELGSSPNWRSEFLERIGKI